MPVEGHAQRVNAPLPRRDRIALAVVVCVSIVAAAAAAAVYLTRSSPHSRQHCVTVIVPSTMGGATRKNCRPQ